MKRAPGRDAFIARGFARRETFDHIVALIPKAYPDTALQLARRGMAEDVIDRAVPWQINVYATDLSRIPDAALTDPELNWHRQQFGRPGLVAAAGLVEIDGRLEVTLLQSDLIQQAYRHPSTVGPPLRTVLNGRFGRWWRVLLNACFDAALELGYERLLLPTARQVLTTTQARVDGRLFARIYDALPRHYACSRRQIGQAEYWDVPLAANEAHIVGLATVAPDGRADDGLARRPALLLFHDVEGDVDTEVDPAECRAAVQRMLSVERDARVRVTYNVLGLLLNSYRDEIGAAGHVLGFHGYDHVLGDADQLRRCRAVDGRVRGYRPPRSEPTGEHEPAALRRWDFEWLLSSAARMHHPDPRLRGGIAYLPVHLDDYPLWTGESLDSWVGRLERLLADAAYVAVGLHDCYAARWLDAYPRLLGRLSQLARIVTAEDVSAEMYVAAASAGAPQARGSEAVVRGQDGLLLADTDSAGPERIAVSGDGLAVIDLTRQQVVDGANDPDHARQ